MAVTVEISGESYKTADNYLVKQQAGAISLSNVDILVLPGQAVPQSMESVQILFDSVPQFFGIIESVDSPDFSSGYEARRYRLSLQSGEVVFKWRLVAESYVGKYTHEIISDLFTNYILPEGITLGAIATTTRYYEEYNVSYMNLYDILKELCDDINAAFYISADKKFYFQTSQEFTVVDMPAHVTALKKNETGNALRSVQIVTGATEETSNQTSTTTWIANQKTVILSYQVAAVISATISGTPVGVGVLGLDEQDTSKTFLWSYGSNVITVNDNATTKPATGNAVVITYRGYYNIIVSNENDQLKTDLAALNGTSGRVEAVLDDATINNFADANTLANTMLEQYNEREETITATCQDVVNTQRGYAWNINTMGITGEYVITERSIQNFGPDKKLVKVNLKNRGFYSRYAQTLTTKEKQVRSDTIVYKQTQVGDTATASEELTVDIGNMVYFPVGAGSSDMTEPALGGFYPIGE